jgi:regulator of replication initiation timing
MVRNNIISVIDTNSEKLSGEWCKEIKNSEFMSTYGKMENKTLIKRNKKVFEKLSKWMKDGSSKIEIGEFFVNLGKIRYKEGFPLCEVTYALYLTKSVFWKLIHSEGLLTTSIALYQALELTNEIGSFFDLGSFYLIRGYLEEMYQDIGKTGKFSKEELKSFFHPGSFYNEDITFDEIFNKLPFFDWKW